MSIINLTEAQVKELLDWPLVVDAVEQSLRSICENRVSENQPTAKQPTRSHTPTENGITFFSSLNSCHLTKFTFYVK